MPPLTSHNNRIVIVAGELSGEIHASHLTERLIKDLSAEVSGFGSTRLEEAGARVIYDYRHIAVTGVTEVIKRLGHIYRAFSVIKRHLVETKPSLLILVDFPGFNLRVAKFAAKQGIPVIYFIPPQVWAWRKGRIRQIKRYVSKVISILPFEEDFYREQGVDVTYVGHPFAATVRPTLSKDAFLSQIGVTDNRPVLTIMPGSRRHEIANHLPLLKRVVDIIEAQLGPITTLLPIAGSIDPRFIVAVTSHRERIIPLEGRSHDALAHCDAAIIASGSATLEAAILKTPSIVIYRLSPLSFALAKLLVKVKYVSLPNIMLGKEVYPEFIQHFDAEAIAAKTIDMLKDEWVAVKRELEVLSGRLGRGDSYSLACDAVTQFLRQRYGALS